MMRNQSGFTLIEAMVVVAVMGIMAAVAVTSSLNYLPDMRLKSASRDLYSNLQKAKLLAVKTNTSHAVFFDTGIGNYQILTDPGPDGNWGTGDDTNNNPGPDGIYGSADDIPEPEPVTLANYKSGVAYGHGNAATNATQGGGAFPPGDVSFNNNIVVFNSRGMLLNAGFTGYVYLANNTNLPIIERSSYAVGVPVVTGIIQMSKWYNGSNSWD